MSWIKTVGPDQADGLLKKIYADAIKRAGKVFQILQIQSPNPKTLRGGIGLYMSVMHETSPLSRVLREMVATVVSNTNRCHY